MLKRTIYLLGAISVFFYQSCTYDNIEEFYTIESCDTLNVSYSSTIAPILDRNCLGCHFSGNGTGVDLDTYQDVEVHVENGSLLGSIKHEPGFSPMPKNGRKLDECTIAKLEKWINDGYPNN